MKYLHLRGLFLLWVFFFIPVVSLAASIGSVHIDAASLTQKESSLQVTFSIENVSNVEQDVTYGVRVQSTDSDDVYEVPVDTLILASGESQVEFATIVLPITTTGKHDVFLLSRDAQGLVSILKYAGAIDVVQSVTEGKVSTLSECLSEERYITCDISNTDSTVVDINYSVNKGSVYTPVLTEGISKSVEVSEDTVTISLSDMVLQGDYTYRLWLGDEMMAQTVIVHMEGDVSDEDSATSLVERVAGGSEYDFIRLFIILAPIVLLIGLLYIALRRPGVSLVVVLGLSIFSTGSVFAAVTLTDTESLAHIFNGTSQDSGDEQFAITLDDTEFQITESIGFSIVFQDTALPNAKPTNGSIDVAVDGGAWESLILPTDNSSIAHKTISAITTVGEHTLSFRSPDLCGGVFGTSIFNIGAFGSTDCFFSLPITIANNIPSTTPLIGGNCVLGESCTVGIVSTDTDGGELCYDAIFSSGGSQSAGCAIEGTPVLVQHTFNSCSVSGTTVQARATDAGGLQSVWGEGSTAVTGSIVCTEPCAHCTYDGVVGDTAIAALPPFIPPSGIVEISWNLVNIATCSVEGRDVAAGTLVDSWDWETVRENQSQNSSPITEATEYTLSCTDLDGTDTVSSVIVSTIPIWQEF